MIRLTLILLAWVATLANLRTKAGRDHQARVMGDHASTGTGPYASGHFIALSTDTSAPNANSTTLTGEITSGSLARAAAIYVHTDGTNLYTLTKAFTSDQDVTVAKIGIFNAASGGTLIFEAMLDQPVNLRSGDQVQITEAINLGG